jgi:hypothetical protein
MASPIKPYTEGIRTQGDRPNRYNAATHKFRIGGNAMSAENTQTCPVCGVKIVKMIGGDRVIFSTGPVGTREVLWAKVCQHTKNLACLNKDKGV